MIFCEVCGEWLNTKTYTEAEMQHFHEGIQGGFSKAKSTGLVDMTHTEVGVKPLKEFKRWRAYWIEVTEGYCDHPSFGHTAGQTLSFTYHLMVDNHGDAIEALFEKELITKLESLHYLKRISKGFTPMSDWQHKYPLRKELKRDLYK